MAIRPATLALNLTAIAVGMFLLAYASVPLYRLFCEATGFGGTTQRGKAAPGAVSKRIITIRFNADIDPGLNWQFIPGEPEINVKIGEQRLTHFVARNLSNAPVQGHATYNVLPYEAGAYFQKIECFCFKNQTLAAHQTVNMPVSFFIDPSILENHTLDALNTITLSYTFFPAK